MDSRTYSAHPTKASDKSWFETGHTTKAVTKGIWVMCRPHPTQEDQVLVLLDTEGIDDPDKIFNNKIKTSIKVSCSEEDDSILDFFFPNFVLTLRDFTLETNNEDDDTFLENNLELEQHKKMKKGKQEDLDEHNLPRILIRRYFKNRKCFRFRKLVKQDLLKELMTLSENSLKTEFRETLDKFRNYIFSCKPKLLKSGKAINGRSKYT
ncbi:guanylate-binding protein 1-like [Mercenaria mercenaria]|uniref:guanylate-binding protein 1-like n=1 Tax=Mercenaria mercenaria TaxID=6596 RepID=UPI00234E4348|nr:guanylate-binding protein 1-like [Mercenaria mercenaria]